MVAGEFVASLATLMLPVEFPPAAGEKVTSSAVLCPGVRTRPAEIPLVANLALELATPVIVTLEFPALASETDRAPLDPTETLPKLILGVPLSSREVAAMPVPLTATLLGEFAVSLVMDTVLETAAADFGEKTTLSVDWLPAPITRGKDIPEIVNPLADALACVTVRFDPPVLDIVTDCETVPPTATDPKLIDGGETDNAAAAAGAL